MTPAAKIAILETRLNALAPGAPLRMSAAIVAELRSLGWGKN